MNARAKLQEAHDAYTEANRIVLASLVFVLLQSHSL